MTARIGSPKTGGRVKGSLDKGARQLLSNEMASDILAVYKKLGGVKWLLQFAKDQPGPFIQQALSRLWPAPQKDDPDVQFNQFNLGELSEMEAGRRIAFALAKAMHLQQQQHPVDITPQQACSPRWQSPDALPDLLPPEPIDDPERQQWAEDLHLTDEQRRQKALIEQTKTGICYGSAAEQGLSPAKRRRRDELL